MNEIKLPAIKQVSTDGNTATYAIEPLTSGYGWTIGSVLKQALLSSLPGQAITCIRLAGWSPEHEQVPGMKETVAELALNCKLLRISRHNREDCSLYLEVAGKRHVTARDIAVPYGVEIMNPDLHLATLTSENASLSLELLMETGKGYVPVEAREVPLAANVIPLDAIYSPVQQVNYSIEKIRVGSLVNFEKLVLTISTDGTITPNDALCQSAAILAQHYVQFASFDPSAPLRRVLPPPSSVPIPPDIDSMPIVDLGLPLRAFNSLKRHSITTVGQVLSMKEQDLRTIRNFGEQALQHLVECIIALNLLPTRSKMPIGDP